MDKTYIGNVCESKVQFRTTTAPADGTQVEVFLMESEPDPDDKTIRLMKLACSQKEWSPELLANLQRKFGCLPPGEPIR